MAASTRPSLEQVKAAFRLVGDCRDLGRDTDAWRLRAVEGLSGLVGAYAANAGELTWPGRQGPIAMVHAVEYGYASGPTRDFYDRFMRDYGPNHSVMRRAYLGLARGLDTQTRSRLINERDWRAAPFFGLFEASGFGPTLISFYDLEAEATINGLILHRAAGERDFSPRERTLVHLFHEELGRLIGTRVASAGSSPGRPRLPRRLGQVFDGLLEGLSEGEIACRLCLRPATVHEYVTDLYRRLDVNRRAELMARYLR